MTTKTKKHIDAKIRTAQRLGWRVSIDRDAFRAPKTVTFKTRLA